MQRWASFALLLLLLYCCCCTTAAPVLLWVQYVEPLPQTSTAVFTASAVCVAALPMHLPQLIPAIQHYHWVLKTCHAGAELDTALTCAQGFVDPDLR